jgi:pantoate kinase
VKAKLGMSAVNIQIYEVIEGKLTKIKVESSGKVMILETKECDLEEFIGNKEEFKRSLEFVNKYLPILEEIKEEKDVSREVTEQIRKLLFK